VITQVETIIFAAIRRTDNCIVMGKDHSECIGKSPKGTCLQGSVQGFLTDRFRFVDRMEAAYIAYTAHQIKNWIPTSSLISENLWCPRDGGKHDYSKEFGYFLS
jgi:hypothetical protein